MSRTEFSAPTKRAAWHRCGGLCEGILSSGARCGVPLQRGRFRYDHILPDWLGGDNSLENCQVICMACDGEKTPADQRRIAKTKRQWDRDHGIKSRKGPPMPGSRASGWKRKIDGTTERRT